MHARSIVSGFSRASFQRMREAAPLFQTTLMLPLRCDLSRPRPRSGGRRCQPG
ncbi:unnamed protein product, partial [Polarella glacialis]